MAYYFGFKPSDKLKAMLDEIDAVTVPNSGRPYYKHRNLIAQQVAQELIETMLLNLIEVMPNSDRKASMKNIAHKVEGSTATLLNLLLGQDEDKDVIPTIDFLYNDTLFIDNNGEKRLGLKLNDETAETILNGFNAVTPDSVDKEKFRLGIEAMNDAAMTHFVSGFANSLPLGIFKRNSVPVAKAGITKVMEIAVHRLLPKLDDAGFNRLANFYRPFIVEKAE